MSETRICPFCGKETDKFIMFRGDIVGCRYCGISKKQTNADRIRAMTDEELAGQIAEWNHGDCPPIELCPKCRNEVSHYVECAPWKCWLDWLKMEANYE